MNAVDTYLTPFPMDVQERLKSIRELILKTVPEAVESMAYGMPAYKYKGKPLVYFAGFQRHIGFYATPTSHEQFVSALSPYKHGKGSVQFPHDKSLPLDLIARMIEFKRNNLSVGAVAENLLKVLRE